LLVRVDNHLFVQAARKIPRFIVSRTAIPVGDGIAGWVAHHRQPLLISHEHELPVGLALRSQGYRTSCFISVPISLGRRVIGVVNVADRHDGQPFTRADLEAILLIARQAADVTRFHQQASEAMRRSRHDPLTQLPNRRSLDQRLGEELERSRRYDTPLGVMVVDLHALSAINHRHGFHLGDQVLKGIADVLRSELRIHDVAFRSGDDEFAILLPNTDIAQLMVPARRIVRRLAMTRVTRRRLPDPGGILASIGLVSAPEHGDSAHDLLVRAQEALEHAEARGTQIEVWRPGSQESATADADASIDRTNPRAVLGPDSGCR
jgi:diguanylate cyclase (GGDEF)-like protein